MNGATLVELLEPVIGKQGHVRLALRGLSGGWTVNDEKHPLVSVKVRPDGLIEVTRDDGWNVLAAEDVLAVEWVSRDTQGIGPYL